MLRLRNGRTGALLEPGTEYTGQTLMRISPPKVFCRVLLLLVEGQRRHKEEATDLGEPVITFRQKESSKDLAYP
jgi:hypothetical protein